MEVAEVEGGEGEDLGDEVGGAEGDCEGDSGCGVVGGAEHFGGFEDEVAE